jgi:hypothetical protein
MAKAKTKTRSKTKAKPTKVDKKLPAKVRKKKKWVKPNYFDAAQIIADIADREAITCSGVKSFPDLLDGTGIKAEDITPGIVHAASEINRRAMQGILDRVEKLNSSLLPKSEFFENVPGNAPSGDTYTGEIFSFTFPLVKRRNKVAATMLKVTKEDAVRLLVELGLKGAEKYSNTKLEKRLRALPATVEQTGQKPKSAEAKALLGEIVDLASEGGKLAVTESGPSRFKEKAGSKKAAKASANSKAKSKAKTKKAVADDDDDEDDDEDEAPKAKKGKKAKADKTKKGKSAKQSGTDKYGSRLGTNNAKINEALSRKWQTMQEIMEGAGLKGTCYDHLNRMVDKGFVEKGGKDDRQYKLTK